MNEPLISVIMPSYLGDFPGAAKNRKQKFTRAVESFLNQQFLDAELIIISDGCSDTNMICKTTFKKHLYSQKIRLVELPRHALFTGEVRQTGINIARGKILCNLDTDDILSPHHLNNVSKSFNTDKYDWAYFGYNRILDGNEKQQEYIRGNINNLCTVNVVWKKSLNVTWNGCDGKQDNKFFNSQLIEKYKNYIQIFGCGYVVKHAVKTLIENNVSAKKQDIEYGEGLISEYKSTLERIDVLLNKSDKMEMLLFLLDIQRIEYEDRINNASARLKRLKDDADLDFEITSAKCNANIDNVIFKAIIIDKNIEANEVTVKLLPLVNAYNDNLPQLEKNDIYKKLLFIIDFLNNDK